MVTETLTKELVQELMEIKGETRGVVFKTDAEFVLAEKGKEGLEKVEQEFRKLGYPVNYGKIETMDFYPLGLRVLSLLVIQRVFKFSKEDIKRMGAQAPKRSLIIKLFMKFFLSLKKAAVESSRMWKEHYTVGQLDVVPHEEERWATTRLKNFALHPVLCLYYEGYFSTVMRMVVGSSVTSKERRCPFRGDKYHEYYFTW